MPNDARRRIGTNLQKARLQRNFSREDIAVRFNVEVATVAAWEAGLVRIDASVLYQFARSIGVAVSSLFSQDETAPSARDRTWSR